MPLSLSRGRSMAVADDEGKLRHFMASQALIRLFKTRQAREAV
jgi:hypothetical protein